MREDRHKQRNVMAETPETTEVSNILKRRKKRNFKRASGYRLVLPSPGVCGLALQRTEAVRGASQPSTLG
jgi:hypothetical protein